MKHILTLAIAVCSVIASTAQNINGTSLKDIDAEYVQIIANTKAFNDRIGLLVDIGQERSRLYTKPMKLMDTGDKEMLFNSMIEALNFMTSNGYELVQAFPAGKDEVFGQYLLRKRKKS